MTVQNRYILLSKIAKGGMAEVYKARYEHPSGVQKTVALKLLLAEKREDSKFLAMFDDEARALLNLNHQNIVNLFDVGVLDGRPFLAMEFVDGVDAEEIIVKNLTIPRPLALYIMKELLQGIDVVHRACSEEGKPLHLVHRDVSPSNILISYQGEVKLTDFGIAKGKHRQRETTVFAIKGKYAYMSPEQAAGKTIDQQTDLFACGVVLYELLTGKRLFAAQNELEVLEKVKFEALPDGDLDHLPPCLRDILRRSLAKSKAERYASAHAFLGDLQAAVRSLGEVAFGNELGVWLRGHFLQEPQKAISSVPVTRVLGVTKRETPQRPMSQHMAIAAVCTVMLWSTGPHQRLVAKPLPKEIPPPTIPQESYVSIMAEPWGYASVKGEFVKRETPIVHAKLDAGEHELTISYPPRQLVLSKVIHLATGDHVRCKASFVDVPHITCR